MFLKIYVNELARAVWETTLEIEASSMGKTKVCCFQCANVHGLNGQHKCFADLHTNTGIKQDEVILCIASVYPCCYWTAIWCFCSGGSQCRHSNYSKY